VNKSKQYRGRLSPAELAEGINVARQNAARLAKDARLLLENERYASALALAVLSIEESGKGPVLRGLAVASDDKEVVEKWREYRSHTSKNLMWPLLDRIAKGARKLDDFLPMFEPNAEHPQLLDAIKQISLYTDSFKKGHWSVPEKPRRPAYWRSQGGDNCIGIASSTAGATSFETLAIDSGSRSLAWERFPGRAARTRSIQARVRRPYFL
jgi:AbiV family abortive infection protein